MPVLLAFDTATEHMSVVLVSGVRQWAVEAPGGAKASATLIPAIQGLLAEAGLAMSAVEAIGYGCGPGAFTGLRTACSVAQGLAFGLGCPVLQIDSLMAVAADARALGAGDDIWVAMDARMDEIYAAHYRFADGAWQVLQAPALYPLDVLVARWQHVAPGAVAGSALDAFGDRLPTGNAARRPAALPRPTALGDLALAAWHRGAQHDAAEARPLYLRDKVALTTAEREQVRQAKAAA